MSTIVIGVGNPVLTDDGVGLKAAGGCGNGCTAMRQRVSRSCTAAGWG